MNDIQLRDTQQEQAQKLIDDFSLLDDWEERYGYLIDMGRKVPPMDEAARTEENRIQGCQSRVWVVARLHPTEAGNIVEFDADSDSAIVKGLIAVMQRVYSGQPAEKIISYDVEGLLRELALEEHLSPSRRNGLHSMVQRIRALAASLTAAKGAA